MTNLTAVVTIYKVAEYLNKCLDSLLKQTYKNFKVLMVVGSDDTACISICNKFEAVDERFRTVLCEAKGLSDARNYGIHHTLTKYITFVDGDDYLSEKAFEELLKQMGNDIDIVIGNYALDYGQCIIPSKTKFRSGRMSSNRALKNFLTGHDCQFVVAWGKIYKTALFKDNQIEYPMGKRHEDNLTTYKLLYYAKAVVYTNCIIYYCVERKNSLTYDTDLKKEKCIIEGMDELREFLSRRKQLKVEIDAYEVSVNISYLKKVCTSKEDEAFKIYKKCVRNVRRLKLGKRLRLRMKFLCIMIRRFPVLMFQVLKKF